MARKVIDECDICKKLISLEEGQVACNHITWRYFKKGKQIVMQPSPKLRGLQEPILRDNWFGGVNRFEFCEAHGRMLNAILRGFLDEDTKLMEAAMNLMSLHKMDWEKRETDAEKEFEEKQKEFAVQEKQMRQRIEDEEKQSKYLSELAKKSAKPSKNAAKEKDNVDGK